MSGGGGRKTITNNETAAYTLPIIILQIIILTIFSLVDPSKSSETMDGYSEYHRVICAHNTYAFFITEIVFEGSLILVGCVLAFKTRKLKDEFNEAEQLILAMYNIALVGSIVVIVMSSVQTGQASQRLIHAMGIFWATTFSICMFAIPRILRARDSNNDRTQVSGLRTN